MIFKVATLLILLCGFSRNNGIAASIPEDQDLDTEKELKALNNSPVKTIQLEGGDIFDCIDFYKQPAFDHPLLKNHKIQMLPQSYVARRMKQLQTARSSDKACPLGTVPIRRTTKEDLVMAKARNHAGIFAANRRMHRISVHMQRFQQRRYHGASGLVSVYSLNLTSNEQFSRANIWIENGPYYQINIISAGWMVQGDSQPRLFIYWTGDGGHKTGCYNMDCKGFVQVDSKIALGQVLNPVSTYGGPIHDVKIKIFQDKQTGNWVLYFSEQDIIVGYLPRELFPYLKYGAKNVAWGGIAYPGNDGISPPMGSGHMPDGQYNHAAYFKNLTYYAYNYIRRHPTYYNTGYHTDGTDCYGLQNGSDYTQPWRSSFLFGGPGGHCGD